MADAASVMATVWSVQSLLASLTALDLTGYMFPAASNVADGSSFDFIIVGGGTAGSVLANRLTEDEHSNVLLIEAGGDPPLESKLAGLFPYQPNSSCDWNLFSQNDNYSSQYHKNKVTALTQGKMLGGSSSLDHMIYVKGTPQDYNWWAEAVGDDSWGWDGLRKYLKKTEKLVDKTLLNTNVAEKYGLDGYLGLEQELHPEILNNILAAIEELGNKIVQDTNAVETQLGYSEAVFTIVNGVRQSNAAAYLGPIKNRTNLHVLKNTLVTKIIFDGTTASGVQAVTSDGKTVTFKANKEVIVSAGAFGSPKLLMLSGIGPKQHLDSFGIKVISDLAGVGQNLQDHISVPIVHTLEKSDAPASSVDPGMFPVPLISGYKAMDSAQTYPDYQAISLFFPHDTASILALCSNVFTYNDDVCNTIYNASIGRNILWTVHNIMHPASRGSMELSSANPTDDIIVHHGIYSDKNDLVKEATYAADFAALVNTTYFKSLGSEMVQFDLPECAKLVLYSDEWWQCYTLQLSGTMYHYSGTCVMGSVVDTRLNVKGVSKLRVVDSSVMPNVISGNIKAAVLVIAEKGADLIKEDNGISVASSATTVTGKTNSANEGTSKLNKKKEGGNKKPLVQNVVGGLGSVVGGVGQVVEGAVEGVGDVVGGVGGAVGGLVKGVGKLLG